MSEVKNFSAVTDRSTKGIVKATTDLTKVLNDLQSLTASSESLAGEILFRQNELNNINAEFDQKFAEAKSDLRIRVLDNEDKVLEQLLKARGFVTITPAELTQVRQALIEAETSNADAIAEAVSKAETQGRIALNAAVAAKEAEHKVAIAELNANSAAKDSEIKFLKEQVEELRKTVTAERETRVKIAEAESQRAGVTINQGKQ